MMKLNKFLFLLLSLAITFTSCKKDEIESELDQELTAVLEQNADGQGLSYFIQPNSFDFNQIPQDPKNPITWEKMVLGKMLFHETGLAIAPMAELSEGTYSCASCHFASAGFQAGRFQGIGEGGVGFSENGLGRAMNPNYELENLDVQPLKSPSVLNVAFQKNMLWNGQFGATGMNVGTESQWTPETPIATNGLGFEGVEVQAIAGLKVHRLNIDESVLNLDFYKKAFDDAFPFVPEEERYTRTTAGLAIAAYERTVFPNKSPFQKYLNGADYALTDLQKKGALLFFGKANCVSCHTGPALNKMDFSALGFSNLVDCDELTFNTPENDPANLGRGGFTGVESDNYKFKIPQLYNLKEAKFYGHGSTFKSIRAVVEYKNEAVAQNEAVPESQLDPLFTPLELTTAEIDQLVDFIENGLYDSDLSRYTPSTLPTENCFPVNDEMSQADLGCK